MLGSPKNEPRATAVIGAGPSGLTVLKSLVQSGIPAVCFERGSRVGGNWVFGSDNGQSRIYRSLCINTSRRRMQFSDFPFGDSASDPASARSSSGPHARLSSPAHGPRAEYAAHDEVARYFEAYAATFDLHRHIRFRTTVRRVEPTTPTDDTMAQPGYAVTTQDGERSEYANVVVANGHHFDPAYPDPPIPGALAGPVLHSHDYLSPTEPHDLRGKRVIVLGLGNSAVDIACELARAGSDVTLSVRRGAWILPKYVFGRPIDEPGILPRGLPDWLRTTIAETWYRLFVGSPGAYGLPKPDHRLGHAHPTLSDELLPLLREGLIRVRPALTRLDGSAAVLSDGTRIRADAVVYCTGYRVTFPFFDQHFLAAPNNELALFLRCFHLEHRGLMFAGLCQPLGAIMPIAEAQGRLFARYINGDYELPELAEMRTRTERERAHVRRRFVASRRHTMQVDFDQYLEDIEREMRAGYRRSGKRTE